MKRFILVTGLLILFAVEIARVYFIMPFPGSQQNDTINLAYWLDRNIIWLRILLLAIIAYPIIITFRKSRVWKKISLGIIIALYAVVFYFFNFRFLAEKMFYQPRNKAFANTTHNKIDGDKLVIAVELNGEAKAYPIEIIGYHHQVADTVGGIPVMVTYCTVCRTGRVFSPLVNGHREIFRLVGMDHFNAMFEDSKTHSWWRQATGVAIAGPLKGMALKEIPSKQSTLRAWTTEHPSSLVLQPDSNFKKQYEDLAGFDRGTIKSGLEKRDSASWKFKSWVVGISNGKYSKAYDWNDIVKSEIIHDSLPGLPVLLLLEKDTTNFHVYNRKVDSITLSFTRDSELRILRDLNTQSSWNMSGLCIVGPMKGKQLITIQAYQEFWHSWNTFHPETLKYAK